MVGLSVKAVAKLSGVSPHTLRAWERRYLAVEPSRTKTGRRVYSVHDAERLKLLMDLVKNGHSIGNIAKLPDASLRSLTGTHHLVMEAVSSNADTKNFSQGGLLTDLIDALGRFDIEEINKLLSDARQNLSPRTFIVNIIAPMLTEIGGRVERGSFSIAQEHAFSSLLRSQLGHLYFNLNSRITDSKHTIAFATPEGDIHEFGILSSAVLAADAGVRSFYIGPNLPAWEFAEAARLLKADICILGTSGLPLSNRKEGLGPYIQDLLSEMEAPMELWVGGSGNFKMDTLKTSVLIQTISTLEMLVPMLQRLKETDLKSAG
ncbi:MAG: MerR family transcriptional regulator [Methylotenera sp.]|nr:MerR family transcriptional regulator [Oligoflexia bacterium]